MTGTAPDSVTWKGGVVLQTVVAKKHYLVIAPSVGVVNVSVGYAGDRSWYWGASRYGRVYYSSKLDFD